LTGIAAPEGHASTALLMRRLLRESVKPYLGWLALAVVFMVVMAGATALSAWLMKPVVNDVFIGRDPAMLWLIGGAVLATFLVKGLANYAQASLMSFVGLRIVSDNQNRLFARLARMDLQFFHDNATGRLISRFTVDVGLMRAAVSNVLTGFGKDTLSLAGLVPALISHRLWRQQFGGGGDVVGKRVPIAGYSWEPRTGRSTGSSYSQQSARIGSIREARSDGAKPAARATPVSARAEATSTTGS